MKEKMLGNTGIAVTGICYGALPIGPIQANLPVEEAAEVIRYSLEQGINFIDTAQRYRTYPHIRRALLGYQKPVVIASKGGASGYDEMRQAVEEARQELDRDVIDIFHLHAARASGAIFAERAGALQYLCDARAKGLIRAVGISSHSVDVVRAAAQQPEIDVVFPLLNFLGLGILDGTTEEMREAIAQVEHSGKGIYLMKVMAGGHLVDRFEEALTYARAVSGVASIAIGMLNRNEVDANIASMEDRPISAELKASIGKHKKCLTILASGCVGCGACVETCTNFAIQVENGKARVDHSKCIMCGYCVPKCPQFALRLI